MTRDEAAAIVAPDIVSVEQYAAVPVTAVSRLLGDELFARMKRDRVRFLGPDRDHIYSWNVIDYVMLKQ